MKIKAHTNQLDRLITVVLSLGVLLSASVLMLGCEPPVSAYRRSALRPGLLGGNGGAPVREGGVRLSGTLAQSDVNTTTPELGDAALHVSETNAVGELDYGLSEHFSIGGRVQGARYGWSRPSADGSPPLIGDELALGFGPSASVHIAPETGLMLGIDFGVTFMEVPWTTWSLADGEAERCEVSSCDGAPPHYLQLDQGSETVALYRGSLTGGYNFGRALGVFGGLSYQNSVTNIGFSDRPHEGSTVEASLDHIVPFLGATARAESGPFVQLQLFLPWSDEVHGLNVGAQATVGIEL